MGQPKHERDVDHSEIRMTPQGERADLPPTIEQRVRDAVLRVAHAAEQVRDARARHLEEFRREGRALAPTTSPRIDQLARAARPLVIGPLAERDRSELGRLDRFIGAMLRDITNDPLWLAADHAERKRNVLKLEALVRQAPQLVQAREAYNSAQKRCREARADLQTLEKQSSWLRWLDSKPRRHQLKLHRSYEQAAEDRLTAKHHVERTERAVRATLAATVAAHNGAELRKQLEAWNRRDTLERPLREALVERHLAEALSLRGETQLDRLQDAPEGMSLRVTGTFHVGTFEVVELKATDGRTYLADTISIAPPAEAFKADCTLEVVRGQDGALTIKLAAPLEHTPVGVRLLESDQAPATTVGRQLKQEG